MSPEAQPNSRTYLSDTESDHSTPGRGSADPLLGARVGHYKILAEVGKGGMGAVYRAVRDDLEFQQEVAIKLVKRGMDTDHVLERFRYERQILALLNHPYIARLLDGGSTADGRPYFAMEYIEGERITSWCFHQKLDVPERLALFLKVCEAVSYAHRHLVVHRDLKPGNILITREGVPKLLDFGIAKLLVTEGTDFTLPATGVAMRPFTPDYASPEQVRGEPLNTATDVYSLGAVLYELLTAKKPFMLLQATQSEIERIVCSQDPTRPSLKAENTSLRGDLDNIVLKAMSKEASRRYSSVEQLAEDVQRYLSGRPVAARSDTFWYKTTKFARRNKTMVLAGSLVALSMVAGTAVSLWQAQVAHTERAKAERRFNDVRMLANSMMFELDEAITNKGPTEARTLLVRKSLDYLDKLGREAEGNAGLQNEVASAYLKMGDIQGAAHGASGGDTAGALASYRKALNLRESVVALHPDDQQAIEELARTYNRITGVLRNAGDYEEASGLDRKAVDMLEAQTKKDPTSLKLKTQLAMAYFTMGTTLAHRNHWEEAYVVRRKALDLYDALAKENPTTASRVALATASRNVGGALLKLNRKDEAMVQFRRALDIEVGLMNDNPGSLDLKRNAAASYTSYAMALGETGDAQGSIESHKKAMAIRQTMAAADPKDWRIRSQLATTYTRIGQVLVKSGAPKDALPYFEKSLPMREKLAEEDPVNAGARAEVAEAYSVFGSAYAALGQRARAAEFYQKSVGIFAELKRLGKLSGISEQEMARVEGEARRMQGHDE